MSPVNVSVRSLLACAFAAAALVPVAAGAQNTLKIGFVTFLSGPAAAPFGVPAKNAVEFVTDELNAGKAPGAYKTKGFGGATIEPVIIDEAGSTTVQVTEFRNLVQRANVDMVIGYVSSGNCLAIAPVAEELKKLTNFFDCGTPRIFEDAKYQYVFRTSPTATMDSVGAALYVTEMKKNIKSIAGINQNYAWGQDSWGDFEAAMKVLVPNIEVKTSQMPKLFAGQYNAEISALLSAGADVIHSSFFDGDLEALILQAGPRGLMKKSMTVLTTGETVMHKLAAQIPDGTVLGARGPFGPYAPDNQYNSWFSKGFEARFKAPPNYASYQMAQAILGMKFAWEKAQAANGGKRPSPEQVAAALKGATFEGPGGTVRMAIGDGHQAIMETAYGMTQRKGGKITITNVRRYPAERVNPPAGVKSTDWIKSGFKK
ncbi:MAG TPA: ABC transporter substrate-binding protein [Burkholderiales bacterium]|nr:ABC transporter substrate-binding protein [Burkholderiales bacterium]